MARINIEIPDSLHSDLKVEAAERGDTLKDTVIDFLEDGVENDEEVHNGNN